MNPNENSHEPLVERALVGFDLAAEHHLAGCEPCQTEREKVQEALQLFSTAQREAANRPESFWEQQAARIRSARNESGKRARIGLALTPGLAVFLLIGIALLTRGPHGRPKPGPSASAPVRSLSDHELLVEVERAMQSDTPLSLEPANLMVEESDSNPDSVNTSKETRPHEN
jgi:hypothetical protein